MDGGTLQGDVGPQTGEVAREDGGPWAGEEEEALLVSAAKAALFALRKEEPRLKIQSHYLGSMKLSCYDISRHRFPRPSPNLLIL